MRFLHPDGTTVHLSYCTNVHPATDLDGALAQLSRFAGPVRRAVGADRLGVGLWLPAGVAAALADDPRALDRVRGVLDDQRLEVVTLNAFPYGGFHDPVVKRAVYRPDWTDPARRAFTFDAARVLAALLPPDAGHGSISTLPLGWRAGWSEASTRAGLAALARLAAALDELEARTGRSIRVGLEPEPGCALERTAQAAELLAGLAPHRVGVCLDACHLAVQFEEPSAAVARLDAAGVALVKAQLSTALRVTDPADPRSRAALARFAEPRFLHQVRERAPGGGARVLGVDDLDEALAGGLPARGEWRTHLHAPIHWHDAAAPHAATSGAAPVPGGPTGVTTTRDELCRTLDVLVGGAHARVGHLDVETYTWTALPPGRRPGGDAALVDGLARELCWARDRLVALGLREAP